MLFITSERKSAGHAASPTQASSGKTRRAQLVLHQSPGTALALLLLGSLFSWSLLSSQCIYFLSSFRDNKRSGALLCTASASKQPHIQEKPNYGKQAETNKAVLEPSKWKCGCPGVKLITSGLSNSLLNGDPASFMFVNTVHPWGTSVQPRLWGEL